MRRYEPDYTPEIGQTTAKKIARVFLPLAAVTFIALLVFDYQRNRWQPSVEACHTVYADSFDIRGAVIEGELDVFDALQLGPESYRTMVLEAYQTEMTTGAFSARWLGMCLAGRIQPREVE